MSQPSDSPSPPPTAVSFLTGSPAGVSGPRPAPGERQRGVTFRAVLIGLLLIPLNTYWVIYVEGIRHWNHCTAMSLFWNTIFCLFLLVVLNLFLKRCFPRARVFGLHREGEGPPTRRRWGWKEAPIPFTQGEFITIYVMITIATALAGHDSLQLGYPVMYMQFNSETLANGRVDMRPLYPPHLTVRDEAIIKPLEW
ncbi:MAG: hypothetical protein FJX77_03485, partial [Armatimonadetes bacterium]|nr:hypothetical protein [Armatimonadota bacterium]